MNKAVYALPGFMPPFALNWMREIKTNEDGSIKLCVYCGSEEDKVYYSLGIPGWCWGFIKDPQYFIDNEYPEEVLEEVRTYSQYLTKVHDLPDDACVIKIDKHGCPVPITERKDIQDKYYWILELPKHILPEGDTTLEISAAGRVFKQVLTRPSFEIHRGRDMTDKKKFF